MTISNGSTPGDLGIQAARRDAAEARRNKPATIDVSKLTEEEIKITCAALLICGDEEGGPLPEPENLEYFVNDYAVEKLKAAISKEIFKEAPAKLAASALIKLTTNRTGQRAAEQYEIERARVLSLIAALNEHLERHQARQQENPKNWGFVGDLEHYAATLEQLLDGGAVFGGAR